MPQAAIPWILGFASAASTATQVYASDQAGNRQEKMMKDQQDKQTALENEAKARQQQEESDQYAADSRDQARKRQQMNMRSAQGRRDTLLTGPLGLTDTAPTAGKTLLGT